MTETTDAAIVQRSCHEPEAFAALYDRHADRIHHYLARRLGADLAEDLTADTFVVAFGARTTYDASRSNARPWLYGIASNLAAKHWRREERALRAIQRLGVDPVAETWSQQADERVSAQALHAPLAGALADLSARDRAVLLLVAWGDLTYAEVAEALDIPIGTVRSRLNRARAAMKQAPGLDQPLPRLESHHG